MRGVVAIYEDDRLVVNGNLSKGRALLTGTVPKGTHQIVAVYLGDETYAPSISPPTTIHVVV